jgi:hypothetical protein
MLRDLSFSHPDLPVGQILMNDLASTTDEEHAHQSESTYVDPFDDVFGSTPTSPALNGEQDEHQSNAFNGQDHHSDIPRLRSLHVTNGYREGIAASKEQHVQAGFDEGYTLGAELGLKAGWCLGWLEGLKYALATAVEKARSGSSDMDVEEVLRMYEEVSGRLGDARRELGLERLCGKEFFGEDGVWVYDVPGSGEGQAEEATFEQIAAAHPVLRKWECEVRELAARMGLRVAQDGEEV